jgi:hypothetical protein
MNVGISALLVEHKLTTEEGKRQNALHPLLTELNKLYESEDPKRELINEARALSMLEVEQLLSYAEVGNYGDILARARSLSKQAYSKQRFNEAKEITYGTETGSLLLDWLDDVAIVVMLYIAPEDSSAMSCIQSGINELIYTDRYTIDDDMSYFIEAAMHNDNWEFIKEFLDSPRSMCSEITRQEVLDIDSLLETAFTLNALDMVNGLIGKGGNVTDWHLDTAAGNGFSKLVEVCLKNGVKPSSASLVQASGQSAECVKLIVDNSGDDIDVNAYENCVVFACKTGKLQVLKHLEPFVPDIASGFLKACSHGHMNIVNWLIHDQFEEFPDRKHLSLAAINAGKEFACHSGYMEIFNILSDQSSETTFDMIVASLASGSKKMFDQVIGDHPKFDILTKLITGKNIPSAMQLSWVLPYTTTKDREWAFTHACEYNHIEIVRGITPLDCDEGFRYACMMNNLEILEILVESKTLEHVLVECGMYCAARYGHVDLAKTLLSRVKDGYNKYLEKAAEFKNTDIVWLLVDSGATNYDVLYNYHMSLVSSDEKNNEHLLNLAWKLKNKL